MTKQSVYISHCLFGISNSTYGCVYEIWMCTVMDSFICILRLLTSWCCCCCFCFFFSTLVNFFLHFYTLFYGVLIVFLRFVYNGCYRLTHTRTQSAWAYRFKFYFFFYYRKIIMCCLSVVGARCDINIHIRQGEYSIQIHSHPTNIRHFAHTNQLAPIHTHTQILASQHIAYAMLRTTNTLITHI